MGLVFFPAMHILHLTITSDIVVAFVVERQLDEVLSVRKSKQGKNTTVTPHGHAEVSLLRLVCLDFFCAHGQLFGQSDLLSKCNG